MSKEQIIIDDQKETIHRLQQECTEKTNAIIALGERLKAKEQECEKYKQTLTDIKDITEKQCNICEALTPIDEYKDCKKCWQGKILQKISEVVE